MAKPLRIILRSTLGTTSEKAEEKAFNQSSKCYSTERGCLPWETSVKKTSKERQLRCKCQEKKPKEKSQKKDMCDELDEPPKTNEKGISPVVKLPFNQKVRVTTKNKGCCKKIRLTYPMVQAVVMKPHPGAPLPGWEDIQKAPPKKPDNC